jgi:hypothetical protein
MGRVRVPPAAERDPRLRALLAAYRVVPVFDKGDDVRDVSEMYGCNIAVRRHVFERIGNFNERLGPPYNAGEDLDLARRMVRAEMRIGYMPQALVYHEVDPTRLTPEYYRQFRCVSGVAFGMDRAVLLCVPAGNSVCRRPGGYCVVTRRITFGAVWCAMPISCCMAGDRCGHPTTSRLTGMEQSRR